MRILVLEYAYWDIWNNQGPNFCHCKNILYHIFYVYSDIALSVRILFKLVVETYVQSVCRLKFFRVINPYIETSYTIICLNLDPKIFRFPNLVKCWFAGSLHHKCFTVMKPFAKANWLEDPLQITISTSILLKSDDKRIFKKAEHTNFHSSS